ncbi:hypothetical protein NLG97_g6584 [Lecanicillium saksenae]|uniref:Uncharacterized protein n=1 Tax=Lecanicillium saksenae TaxID=468837 RepID=A0ACC1QQV4_9HYPO|nr:hypothetical protein NLG97_g6584 [Lecanicillium saksenae]
MCRKDWIVVYWRCWDIKTSYYQFTSVDGCGGCLEAKGEPYNKVVKAEITPCWTCITAQRWIKLDDEWMSRERALALGWRPSNR